ncbi:MAG TPA: O-antigen ligase family protein, partial [Gammaproteobacteria bacterium]
SSVAIDPERMIGYVWKGYVVAALIAVGWGLLEFLGLLPYADTDPVRVQGPFKDPNVLAPFLTPAAVYSIHRVFQIGMRGLAWNVSVFLICSFGIFLSFSRGGWLNLVLSFGIYVTLAVFFSRTIREKFALVLIAPTAAFLAVTITLVALSSSEDLARFLAQRAVLVQSYDVEEGGRFASTLAALREVGQNPIGVGPGRTAIEFGLAPHNLYVHILAEGGWLAAFGFYGFVVLTLSRCLSLIPKDLPMKRDAILVSACLLGTLTQSLFIDATHWRHLWLLLALAWVPSIASQRYRVQRQRYVMSNAV